MDSSTVYRGMQVAKLGLFARIPRCQTGYRVTGVQVEEVVPLFGTRRFDTGQPVGLDPLEPIGTAMPKTPGISCTARLV